MLRKKLKVEKVEKSEKVEKEKKTKKFSKEEERHVSPKKRSLFSAKKDSKRGTKLTDDGSAEGLPNLSPMAGRESSPSGTEGESYGGGKLRDEKLPTRASDLDSDDEGEQVVVEKQKGSGLFARLASSGTSSPRSSPQGSKKSPITVAKKSDKKQADVKLWRKYDSSESEPEDRDTDKKRDFSAGTSPKKGIFGSKKPMEEEKPVESDSTSDESSSDLEVLGKRGVSSKTRLSAVKISKLDSESDSTTSSEDEIWQSETGLDRRTFEQMTAYFTRGNNKLDNENRARLMGMPEGVRIAPGANVRLRTAHLLGQGLHIGLFAYINGDVRIDSDVLIGPHCTITSNTHRFNATDQSFVGNNHSNPIHIKRGAWIAANVTITDSVTIGECALVCAGAVVTHDVPDYAIAAGIPARIVGSIDPSTGQQNWFGKDGAGH